MANIGASACQISFAGLMDFAKSSSVSKFDANIASFLDRTLAFRAVVRIRLSVQNTIKGLARFPAKILARKSVGAGKLRRWRGIHFTIVLHAHLNNAGIDPLKSWTQLCLIEVAVAGNPATDARIAHRGKICQEFVTALPELPPSHFF